LEKKKRPPVTAGDSIELDIVSLSSEANGVGRLDGYAVFVEGALPKERVLAQIKSAERRFARAVVKRVITPSADRRTPDCEYEACGGCSLTHMEYEAQLRFKRQVVKDALERIGGFKGIDVKPVIEMEHPYRYRNKASIPFAERDEEIIMGGFERGSRRVVEFSDCLINHPDCIKAANEVRHWARDHGVLAYDPQKHSGVLRHMVARTARDGGLLVCVVINSEDLPYADELVDRLRGLASGILYSVNTKRTQQIMTGGAVSVWGESVIKENINGIRLEVGIEPFMQVNTAQAEKLYAITAKYAGGAAVAVDAYCGTGLIALSIASGCEKVIGVEIEQEAVNAAQKAALDNGITNAEFVCAKAEHALPDMLNRGLEPDVVVVDPPRKGCDAELIQALAQSGAQRIVYVSCNPSTLARDAKELAKGGYAPVEVQPVDMFPWTEHVETVVLMSKKDT
jgi:23S rRNA (uracil1939-C5)-methyltransferase